MPYKVKYKSWKEMGPREIEQIKTLGRCHCPDSEIAAFMELSERSVRRHFGRAIKEAREAGKSNLRAAQFRAAIGNPEKGIKPNATMMIWVGKQILNQRDRAWNEHTGKDGAPLPNPTPQIIVQLPSKNEMPDD